MSVIVVHETVIKNDIPVVLLEGTGGCCDLFSKCYQLYDDYHAHIPSPDPTKYTTPCFHRKDGSTFAGGIFSADSSPSEDKDDQIKAKLREKLLLLDMKLSSSSTTETSDGNDGIDYFQLVYECIHTRRVFLNFIDLKVHSHIEPDLDLAILQALLKGRTTSWRERSARVFVVVTSDDHRSKTNKEYQQEQLNLAFEWKRIDIVKNFIMKDERDWKVKAVRCFRKRELLLS